MAPEGGRPTDPSAVPDVDPGLVRNRAGTARDRSPAEPVEELELEQAIARNARALRLGQGFSVGDMAERIGISKAMLSKIENAQTSCSLSTLARLAAGLDVPVTTLLRGAESERPASYVAAGTGARIVRAGTKEGHEYELLGSLRGEHKRLECLLVTLTEQSETYPLFQHPGTEFIYVLEGTMDYRHSRTVYRLGAGDSLQLDGEGMHGPTALHDLPIRFLSVIAFPEATL
ncbi:helix-turn-helix domain-containing protein [uncultured Nocardioides sp.]|uniref:helix-turn-helix domain-containing protein n=1 Tax=uncultured Nocardioides sp. TaxID=198441 RepID=UPI002638056D|nr:helix-turn-helix domain-containing protein [uncultured Nocardioides sp.]